MQERGEAINTTQRPDEQDPAAALDTLPDDLLLHIVVACGGEWLLGVPELHGRGERSWQPVQDVLEQLYRPHPLVYRRVHSLPATMERLTRCPW